jgi:hypothetical protein
MELHLALKLLTKAIQEAKMFRYFTNGQHHKQKTITASCNGFFVGIFFIILKTDHALNALLR